MRLQGASCVGSLCLGVYTLLATGIVLAAVEERKIDLFVGEVKVLENMNVARVAVGNGKLLRVRLLDNGQMLIIAEKKGQHLRAPLTQGRAQDESQCANRQKPIPRCGCGWRR